MYRVGKMYCILAAGIIRWKSNQMINNAGLKYAVKYYQSNIYIGKIVKSKAVCQKRDLNKV